MALSSPLSQRPQEATLGSSIVFQSLSHDSSTARLMKSGLSGVSPNFLIFLC